MSNARLIHTGQVVIDLVMPIDRLPAPGGDTLARGATFEVGGGFNVMAAARRDGMAVLYIGGHGRGRFGDMAREAMTGEGIVWLAPIDDSRDTGFCVALVDQTAERTFITHAGAEVGACEVLDQLALEPHDHVLVSGYTLFHDTRGRQLTDWLSTLPGRTPIVFDPGPLVAELPPERLAEVMRRAALVSCNAAEARALAGTASLEEAIRQLPSQTSAPLIVIRDGPRGCHVLENGHHSHATGFATKAIDTNGAGDAHTGVLIAALSRGSVPKEAARRANAAAALAVSRYGPATAPETSEIEALLRRHPA